MKLPIIYCFHTIYCGRWRIQCVIDEPHMSLVQLQSQRIVVSFVQQDAIVLVCCYLKGNVCLRANFGRWQLHIGILPNKVHRDELLTLLPSKASKTAADGLLVCDDALGPVLALVVITWARLEQNHRWRSFTEKSTEALRTDAGVAIDCIYADSSMATLMAHTVIVIYFTVFATVTRQALASGSFVKWNTFGLMLAWI